jgi:hypothetical protein
MNDEDKDVRPRPDPTVLTTIQLDREIGHLKELMDKDRAASTKAIEIALEEMNRRLAELNELRKAVELDRVQFVRGDVYFPAHDEMRRQRTTDRESMVAMDRDVKQNATDLAEVKSSLMWLSRLVIGAVILAIIAFGFKALAGR